jgi:predicted ATPase
VLDAATRFPELLQKAGSDLEELVPGLRLQLGASFERARSAHDGKALAERIGRFLLQYSTRQTLVLHLGDLQWADESTVQTIELLLHELRAAPSQYRLAVYASFRPAESQGQPWGLALPRLAEAPGVERLELEPLGASSVSRMLTSMLGTTNLDVQVASRVAAMTRGNPLFVEETLRYLVDWGLLIRRGARLELLANIEDLPLPTTMAQALSMAFEGLSQDEIDLVQALAVLGRPASASLLAAILKSELDEVHRRARALMPRHFLSRSWTEKDYVYALRHDQFSHTLYERLSPVPKARLHASVAEVLEAAVAAASDPAAIIELAVHFSEGISARPSDAGYRERAFRWCVEAGNLAARMVSYAKAAELLDRAQRLAMRGGEPYRQSLLDVTIALVLVLDTLDDDARKDKELQRVERLVKMMQQPVLASGSPLPG